MLERESIFAVSTLLMGENNLQDVVRGMMYKDKDHHLRNILKKEFVEKWYSDFRIRRRKKTM